MAAEAILKAGEIELPAPVSLSISDELIWTADTGRTLNGKMTEWQIEVYGGIGSPL